jgi:serine/threonine protein kinase
VTSRDRAPVDRFSLLCVLYLHQTGGDLAIVARLSVAAMTGLSGLLRSLFCGLNEPEEQSSPIPHYHRTDIHSVYKFGERLGQCGTFGEARAAVHKKTGQEVAIKTVHKHKCLIKMLRNEEAALKVMQHGNITRLYSVYEDRKSVHFVLEKCSGGDLIDQIVRTGMGRLCEDRARTICYELALGISHLHKKGFAHCDIKPSNILFHKNEVKLIDFGVSQMIGPGCILHAEVGSPSYMAPEVFTGSYTDACDLWSLGVVIFVMLFGFNAFNPRAESECCVVHRKICARVLRGFDCNTRNGYGAFFPSSVPVSAEAKEVIAALLTSDPCKRPTVEELLTFPWFGQISV